MKKKDFLESKLGKFVILLEEDQLDQLGKWLEMPLQKYPKKLPQLFKIIRKYAPAFESATLELNRLYKRLYPGKPINVGTIKNLFTELIVAIEDYLIYDQFQKSQLTKDQMRIKAYRSLGQSEKAIELLTTAIHNLKNSKVEDPDERFALADFEFQQFDLVRNKWSKSAVQLIMKSSLNSINKAYALYLSRQLIAIQHREEIFSEKYDIQPDQERLAALSQSINSPLLALYNAFIQQEVPTVEKTLILFEQYNDAFEKINHIDQKYLFYLLLNNHRFLYHNELINASPYLKIYQYGLVKGFMFQEKLMSIVTYSNIVVVSNLAGEFDYTRKFINTYTAYLPLNLQVETKLYAESHLLYKSGDLQGCLDTCSNYSFSDSGLSIRIQLTLLQAYFDLFLKDRSYFELLENFSFSYEKRVRRNPGYRAFKKETYLKSILFVRNLAKAIFKSDHKMVMKLLVQIQSQKGLQGFLWWSGKIKEIKDLGFTLN